MNVFPGICGFIVDSDVRVLRCGEVKKLRENRPNSSYRFLQRALNANAQNHIDLEPTKSDCK